MYKNVCRLHRLLRFLVGTAVVALVGAHPAAWRGPLAAASGGTGAL